MPSDHEILAQPGMSKPEFLSLVEDGVPDGARFSDFTGDTDLTLSWTVRHIDSEHVEQLVAAEAAAWREWQAAEQHEKDLSRRRDQAAEHAQDILAAWRHAAAALAEVAPARLVHQTSDPAEDPAVLPTAKPPEKHAG